VGAASETNPQDGVIFLVAAFCGLRLGELLDLRWGAIDFDAAAIHVESSYVRNVEATPTSPQPRSTRRSTRSKPTPQGYRRRLRLARSRPARKPRPLGRSRGRVPPRRAARRSAFDPPTPRRARRPEAPMLLLDRDRQRQTA
jgi:integrase